MTQVKNLKDLPTLSKLGTTNSLLATENATGKTHIVCEVHDNGAFNLVAYRRIIIRTE